MPVMRGKPSPTAFILLAAVLSITAGFIMLAIDWWNLGIVLIVVGAGLWMLPNAWLRTKS